MPIRARADALLARLASEPQFPTQGETIFVDLERAEVRRGFMPRRVVETLLGGRGVNMFLLYNRELSATAECRVIRYATLLSAAVASSRITPWHDALRGSGLPRRST